MDRAGRPARSLVWALAGVIGRATRLTAFLAGASLPRSTQFPAWKPVSCARFPCFRCEKSINVLDEAMATDRAILLCAQKKAKVNDPRPEGIHNFGTIGSIIQLLRLPDGTVKVLVEGKSRARIGKYIDHDKYFLVEAEVLETPAVSAEDEPEIAALMRSVQQTFENYVKLNKRVPPELAVSVQSIDSPSAPAWRSSTS